jgi:hypothetical protein
MDSTKETIMLPPYGMTFESVTTDVMVTAGFHDVWDFIHKTFSCVAISA